MPTILNGIELGIQSFCYRNYSNEGIAEELKKIDVGALEICQRHVDATNADQVEEVLKLYQTAGIKLTSFGINPYTADEAVVRPLFEFAKKAGIKLLGANPDPNSYELLERLCEEYDVRLAIHNHGIKDEKHGTIENLQAILSKTSDRIGLCIDTGWMIDAGQDPIAAARQFGDRVYGIHFKDFSYDQDGNRKEAILGEGKLDLSGLMTALKEIGFNGYGTIEYEGSPDNPTPNIKKCVDAILKA